MTGNPFDYIVNNYCQKMWGNPGVAYTYYVGRFGHNISVGFPLMPETSLR